MASLVLKDINKYYTNTFHAVKDLNLTIDDKEFIILVGPSGCGKSTSLRMIAGLEEISSGELYIDDKLVNDVEPKDRDIAMVFQNYALYPHMTVFDNMAFGLKLRKMSKEEIQTKVNEAAEILNIKELLNRKPKELSGGQRQRVALGRAIVREPKVFLMDEPLSNLDAKLRVQMRSEINKLHKKLQTTFIYVTHDQTEAMTMGTRIVVMKDGIVQQVADPQTIYEYPANLFVAGFIGSPQMNFINCNLVEEGDKIYAIFGNNKLLIPTNKANVVKAKDYIGKDIVLGIRPKDLYAKADATFPNEESTFTARIDVKELLGSETYLYLKLDDIDLISIVQPNLAIEIGERIEISVDMNKCHLFDKDTEQSIL
ncbi:multiple sugar transport system ATP-binding protein [Natronincola peptidivorans]|uniref:Multiple sugar transport system ATP-binding protein n=1 Tax=Natronincola peptidivorans TaxID=426128 RepID=A0A1I0GK50_9FIRM|nr:sn-glycerol-3-phosphate ABC transporter ATP-binding protein UgpC [Natronincola peptidivorans]SET71322.1 multiple sugar transport system ATP-binding protein [Natronincola peptidivorans]